MTEVVYAMLQLITKEREKGITVMELGRPFEIDQKSVYHYVKVLLERGIM